MPTNSSSVIVEAVVKLTEVCNINCTYCYVFNRGDESYKKHAKYMQPETIRALAEFLSSAATELNANEVRVDFHGGEPLMMKKQRFDEYCELIKLLLPKDVRLIFGLQTNGMLVDEGWIELFHKYQVNVGVSLDGPKDFNDRERVDHQGRGTYDRARRGLDMLRDAQNMGRIPGFGVLTVANPEVNGGEVYRHFVHDVKIDSVDFLLPIESHDQFDATTSRAYGQFLCDAFDAWIEDDDAFVHVRLFSNVLSFMQNGATLVDRVMEDRNKYYHLITVSSNGDIGPDDALRTVPLELFDEHTISNSTLKSYESSRKIELIRFSENTLPNDCMDCAWKNICRGGAAHGRLINRFSEDRGFNNKSIICEGLQLFYSHVAARMLSNGIGFEQLKSNLIREEEAFVSYGDRECGFAKSA